MSERLGSLIYLLMILVYSEGRIPSRDDIAEAVRFCR